MAREVNAWAAAVQIALSTKYTYLRLVTKSNWLDDRELNLTSDKVLWQMQWSYAGEFFDPGADVRMVRGFARMDFYQIADHPLVGEANSYSAILEQIGKLHEVCETLLDPDWYPAFTGSYEFAEGDEPTMAEDPVRVGKHVRWAVQMTAQLVGEA